MDKWDKVIAMVGLIVAIGFLMLLGATLSHDSHIENDCARYGFSQHITDFPWEAGICILAVSDDGTAYHCPLPSVREGACQLPSLP